MTLAIIDEAHDCPLPIQISAITKPFWDGLAEGIFQTTQCSACKRLSFPPKAICPDCGGRQHDWAELSGRGLLYSYTTVHAVAPMFEQYRPLRTAIVDLEEGVRLVTRLLEEPPEGNLDVPVQLVVLRYVNYCLFAARLL